MARTLIAVDVTEPLALREPLIAALDGTGPAVFPVLGRVPRDIPAEVSDDAVLVVETSGSTARPKRVWHSAESLRASARQSRQGLGASSTQNFALWWLALPAHYVAGVMVLVRAIEGAGDVIAKNPGEDLVEGLHRFNREAQAHGRPMQRYTSMVPKQLSDLVQAADSDAQVREALASFDRVLVGGQRVPDELVARAGVIGVSVTKTYGSAETAGGCVWDGHPLGDTTVDIVDGRVALSGPMLAGGYLGDQARTDRNFVMREDTRWFITDDVGTIRDGVLTVTGRSDRVIISGGVKVSLDEVEGALQSAFPTIPLAVVGVADDTWGQAIVVVAERELGREQLQEVATAQFGPAARIRAVRTIDPIPRLPSGKPDHQAISQLVGSSGD